MTITYCFPILVQNKFRSCLYIYPNFCIHCFRSLSLNLKGTVIFILHIARNYWKHTSTYDALHCTITRAKLVNESLDTAKFEWRQLRLNYGAFTREIWCTGTRTLAFHNNPRGTWCCTESCCGQERLQHSLSQAQSQKLPPTPSRQAVKNWQFLTNENSLF